MAKVPRGDVGLELVIAYKNIKGAVELVAGGVLGYFVLRGRVDGVERWAHVLQQHVTNKAMVELAKLILQVSTPKFLRLTTLALLMDGVFSFGEAYALHKRWWWGPWLVVAATSVLIPFEVYELFRHVRAGRLILFVLNVAVVVYLVRRQRRESAPTPGLETAP